MSYIPEMKLTDNMCQEKKEEENLAKFKVALMHQNTTTRRLQRKARRKTVCIHQK